MVVDYSVSPSSLVSSSVVSAAKEYHFTEQFDRVPRGRDEPRATTVGTIAIGSDELYRIVLAILRAPSRTCDWVRIRITEMVPGMLEIGANLIEALDLYRIHQEFIEKIENRHEEIREVLRKADVMVESTDEGQSQVYQAMAISLKDAWKELMMRMEERKILLEMAIGFYRSGDDYQQHLEYAFAVCNSTLIADNIEQVQVLIEEHQEMKKTTAQHSMTSIQSGQELIDKIVDIGRNLESTKGSNEAVMASNNVEKLLAELHDRRSILEELWLQRKIRLEQSLLIFQLDSEIQLVTNWFLTSGADNMHHVDLGNNPTETSKLIQIHQDFTNEAKLIETRITRVLRSVDTLILTGHEDGDNLRDRVGEIESLNRDILQKIENRRKRLALTMEFWNSASKAFERLTEIEEQIEETLKTPDSPKLDSKWKPDRLAKLSQAVMESTTPAIREGHIILDKSTVGADGVKYIVEKLKERCVPLCSACSEIRNERSTLFVSYDEKYSVITTWLVNIGLDLLSKRKALGVSVQDASDFFDHHLRLKEDLKSRYVDVESCANAVESMEINEETEASEARLKVEELKTRWRTLIIFTEQRILLAETFLEFLERSAEMVNLMDTLEELLKLENWNLDRRTLEGTRRIWMEKFRVMNETYETVYYKGRCFLKDSKTQTLNDKQLKVVDTVTFVEQQLEVYEERRRVINDLWDTWKLRTPLTGEITTQWDLYSNDTSKSLSWIVQIQKRLFAPLVIGDPKHCRQTAYVMKDRLAEIKICYKRVTSEVERWLKVGEMLNIKEHPTKSGESSTNKMSSPSAATSEDLQKVPERLISEHKSFQTQMQLYDVHISELVNFLLALAELYDVIDTTYVEVEKAKKSEDAEYIIEVLKLLDSTKGNEIKLYKSTLDTGEKFLAAVDDSKHDQPARKEAQTILANLKLDHEHWLTWCQEWCEDLQDKIHAATTSNRTLYILQCIDQFWSELRNMEGAYGDGTENLKDIARNFELWLQDLMSFGDNEYKTFLDKIKDADLSEESNINRCRDNWSNLQKDVEKHKSHLELAREYHILLDELETLSLEYRDVVVEIAKQTCDAHEAPDVEKLREKLDNCEQKVNENYRSKLDRVYELAKQLFDPVPKYLDNLWTRKTDLVESINTVRTEIRVKLERFTWTEEETVQRFVSTSEKLFSLPTTVPSRTPPKIITGLQDYTTKKGEPANFSCVLYGSEPMKVKWQKDGKRLIDSTSSIEIKASGQSHSLKIPSTSIEDIGTITVIAENDFGKTNSSAYLHVQRPLGKPPTFLKLPEAICRLDEGTSIRLEAQLDGSPTPDCIWYKNGRELTPDDRIKLRSTPEGVHQLVINDTTPSDSGDYTCCAINDCGETSKTSKVTVDESGVPPHLLSDLRDLEIEEGKRLKWEVQLEGNPRPLVKWFKDNEDMSQFDCEIEYVGSSCALILDEVFPEDEGNYMVVASNIHGVVQSCARLNVAIKGEPPKFVKKPIDADVKDGEIAEFSCSVTGYPTPEVKWYHKDGEQLVDGDDFSISCKNGTSKLVIAEVIPGDAGKIVCRAVNKLGEASATVQLIVNTKTKPFFEVPITDFSCRELDPVNFECKISGDPKPTVQWLHNGEKIIPDNKNVKITATGSKHNLTIKESQYADRGIYKVIATNSQGEEGCTAFLDVEELPTHLKPHPPRIESQMASQLHATEGEKVTLECEISANPAPEITWFKDRNQRIRPGPDLQITQVGPKCVLRILRSITEDSGLYTLQAKNKLGETSASCNIYIKEKTPEPEAPEFDLGLKETIAKEGAAATFECIVKGVPLPTVAWYLNGEKLTEGPDQQIRRNEFNHLLKLQNLEVDDTGPVTVTASNIAGTVSSTAPLIVQMREKKPVLIQPLTSVKVKLGEEALMSCKVANLSNKCDIKVLKDDKLVGDDSKVQLVDGGKDCLVVKIPDVTAEDEGQFCVEVSNSAGTVSSSGFCQVVEKLVKPSLVVTDETDAVLQTDLDDMFDNVEVYLPIHEVSNKLGSTRNITKSEDVMTKKSTVQLETNLEPPVFISELLQPPIVEVGQNAFLEIIVRGVPDPEVEWLKDEKKVDTKRCRVSREDGKCSLEIIKATAVDEGEYSIVAKNPAGIAQCTCQILIDDSSNAPVFTERLSTKEVEEEQSLELQASVRGNSEPKVTWYLNGKVFKPSKGDSITQEGPRHKFFIKSISKDHAGQISIIAENERGKATSSAEIIVTAPSIPPSFDINIEGQTVNVNEPIRFHCVIRGDPQPEILWTRNGHQVTIDGDRIMEVQNGHDYYLTIHDAGPQDRGIYSCSAENKKGKAVSVAEVYVSDLNDLKPVFLTELSSTETLEESTICLMCQIDPDRVPEQVLWLKNDVPIEETSRMNLQVSNDWWTRLVINDVIIKDSGVYKCVAMNQFGSSETSCTVIIRGLTGEEPGPRILLPLPSSDQSRPLHTNAGEELKLKIVLDDPDVDSNSVHWYKNSQLIQCSERIKTFRKDYEYFLVILDVQPDDSAEYSVSATNKRGEQSSSNCFVLVKVPFGYQGFHAPQFASALENVTVYVEDRVELICNVSGYPLPQVSWNKDGKPLMTCPPRVFTDGGHYTYRLVIDPVELQDEGLYVCHAGNEGGQAESSCYMHVEKSDPTVVPKFIRPLGDVTQPENTPLNLRCKLSLPCKVTWLKDNQPITMTNNKYDVISQNNEHSLSVSKPNAADSGHYSVRAVSTDGKKSSSTSCDVVIQAIREAPLIRKKIEDLTVTAGQTATFEVEISGDPEPEVNWYRDGAKIVSSKDFQISKYGTRYSLCIPEVFPEDHGTFSVEAKNVAGTDRSCASLNIRDPDHEGFTHEDTIEGPHFSASSTVYSSNVMSMIPFSISKHLDPVDVREGSPTALQCELRGYPSEGIVVSWTKDGVEVDNDPNYSFTFEHGVARCFISECFPEDSGTWTCCFSHVNGTENEVIASSTTLICREAQEPTKLQRSHEDAHLDSVVPEIIKPLAHQRMVEGGHAMFQCMVSGFPPPDIKWMKNNQILQSGYRYKIMNDAHSGNCSLSISFLLPDEDYGTYTCIASNVKGQVSTEASLLDEEAYKQYLAELQKTEFVGELSDRVRVRSPSLFKNNQKKDVYVPRYEMNLAKNVHRRLESLSSPGEESVMSPIGDRLVPMPRHPGNFTRRLPTDFNVTNFEDRLLSEIEFPADRLDSGHPSAESIDAEYNTVQSEILPPSFVSRIQGSKLFEGTKTAFECVLKGNPSPMVDWFYNGHQIFNSQRVSVFREPRDPKTGLTKAVMRIVPVLLDDTGFYTVLARNHRGRIVCSAQLQVMKKRLPRPPSSGPPKDASPVSPAQPVENSKLSKPLQALEDRNKKLEKGPPVQSGVAEKHLAPCFTKKSIDVHAKQGKTARFDCNVAGRPTPTLTWYHEGRLITTEDPNRKSTIREDGTYSLIFHTVHLSDGGQYECVATNKGGEARFMVRLIVDEKAPEEAPHIIEKPAHSLKVDEGEPLAFQIRVTGYPEPTFSIVKDRVKRDPFSPDFGNPDFERPTVEKLGVGSYQIYFPHGVFKEDNGWYTCGARNAIGSDTFSFKLNVNALLSPNLDDDKPKPVKISVPKRSAPIGTPLPPLPSEPPKPSYVKNDEWDEDELFTSGKPHQAPRFKKLLQDNVISEGNKTFLECTVMPAGDPTMVVEWFKDGRPILHGTRMKPIFEFGFCVLEFDDVWAKDGGLFTCRATNKSGQAEVSCRISVQTTKCLIEEPQFPQDENGPLKQVPSPKRQTHIVPFSPTEPPNPSYVKKDEWGDDELFTAAKPHQAPKFKKFLQNNSIVEGNKTFLECTVMPAGDPTMVVEWFKDGRPILHGTRMRPIFEFGFCVLEFDDVWAKDGGLYTCRALNKVGQAEVSCRIAVKTTKCLIEESQLPEDMQAGYQQLNALQQAKNNSASGGYEDEDPAPPTIVQYPEDVDIQEGMTAKFMCRIVGNPVPTVFWYRNQQLLSNSQRISIWYDGIHRLEMTKCRHSDSGSIVLIARNQYGEIRHDNSLMVRKKSVVQMSKVSHKSESQVMMKFVSTSDGTASNGHVQTGGYYGN